MLTILQGLHGKHVSRRVDNS